MWFLSLLVAVVQHEEQVAARREQAGVDGQGLPAHGFGFGQAALLHQQQAQVAERVGMAGPGGERLLVRGLGLAARAPLATLRPLADGFELRAVETSKASAAGRVAVELARERMVGRLARGAEAERQEMETGE